MTWMQLDGGFLYGAHEVDHHHNHGDGLGTLAKKKTGKCGNFEKTGGGGLPESHFHVLLFLTWENPQKRS